jgi:serine/threonine protein kinase
VRCALKRLQSQFRRRRPEVAALRREYEIASKFSHPRIIRALDFGIDDVDVYLALELYAAPNMKQLLQKITLQPGSERLDHLYPRIVDDAAQGLEYLHAQGYVHRDVKPHNFLVGAEGATKLIDFSLAQKIKTGLARLFGGKSKVQGTRSYMSPEQIRGQALDVRADVYSFGCTVHELFTGKPPYTGASADDLLMKHLKSAPPTIETQNKLVSSEFGELIRRCLAKNPKDRPASMSDFLQELRSLKVYKVPPRPGR